MENIHTKTIKPEDVVEVLKHCGSGTKVYFGSDSEKVKINGVWYVDYIVVLAIHKNGKNGCKVFGEITREKDFDGSRVDRPFNRMMTETAKVVEVYERLKPHIEPFILEIEDFDIAIHLDINPNEMYGSSCAVQSAIGVVKATCNITPHVKPMAPMASYAADRWKEVGSNIVRRKSDLTQTKHFQPKIRKTRKA